MTQSLPLNPPFWFNNPARGAWYVAHMQLGAGGFGNVWGGYWVTLPIAIKVRRPTGNVANDRSAWYHEQSIYLQCIGQPHIVQSYDQFETNSGLFVLILERGECDLQSLIDQGVRFSPKDVSAIGCQLLHALSHLHGIRVVQRDVTPKNIVVFNNRTIFKLGDFDASRSDLKPGELAKTIIGQKGYYAPEMLRAGQGSCFQSDIYQLGVVLLTLLIGRRPIPANASLDEANRMTLDAIPRLTAESVISTYGRTAEIIARMLPRTLEYRYQTAAQAWADFNTQYNALVAAENAAKATAKEVAVTLGAIGALWAMSNYASR